MPAHDVREKVEQWLREWHEVVVNVTDGSLLVPALGKTALHVSVDDVLDDQVVRVEIDGLILMNVPVTAELFESIGSLSNGWLFGGLVLKREDDANDGTLAFRQTLLGDALDKGEFELMTRIVISCAQQCENLKARFGGRHFHDDDD